MLSTVGVVEDVEDVLPVVVPDDVDDGRSVHRSDVERKHGGRGLTVHEAGVVATTALRRRFATPTQRLIDGRSRTDDGELERGGELGDDVGGRTGHEAEDGQHSLAIAGQPADYTSHRQ